MLRLTDKSLIKVEVLLLMLLLLVLLVLFELERVLLLLLLIHADGECSLDSKQLSWLHRLLELLGVDLVVLHTLIIGSTILTIHIMSILLIQVRFIDNLIRYVLL